MQKINPGVKTCYCINFRRSANAITKFYDKRLESLGVTANQLSLLSDIKILKVCNRTELAQFSKLDRTTIVRNLATLEHKGFVTTTDGKDNRENSVKLTEIGYQTLKMGTEKWKQAQQRVFNKIGAENISVLKQIFDKIGELDEEK